MSINVTPAMQVKYSNNVKLRVQQTKPKLVDAISWQSDSGAEKVKVQDLVGNTEPQEATERHGDTKYNNPTYDGVWIPKTNELYYADLIDNADRLATAIDLQGSSVRSGAGTINRAKTRRILEGFYGPIISGKEGTTVTAFPSGQIIPATTGGASGALKMNTMKLRAANKLLTQGYADEEEMNGIVRYMVLTADDNDALLSEVPATSSDFKGAFGGEFVNGKIMRMLGWQFIHLELDNPMLTTIPDLATDGSGFRKTPFWIKEGVRGNWWQESRTMVDPLPQKLGSVQVFAGTTLAASRLEPEMSGIILNAKG
ncbi:MAG: hypothetical protein B7Y36_08245 [Novosphingobium sp. 28-62-57]|uniref:phage capsid protein n=1 Tax=unclassified Novosphingobium TaxID=2644732 RepID=UPI000BDB8817|nr:MULTISPECIES: phage capsid protein [unclassified Novosphingobium]OYW47915.1 MAG: hypothetical protein B7Z36_01340 [Novosphingobium sp. 12-63-9]OYZ10806.1 MAG: hypothetical protein B7Y36_08245 [Novosphingobium sp. 28-62-57]HQS69739.1 phage capsid protein [Novosphingobium sp.]